MKKYLFALLILVGLVACDSHEKERADNRRKLDSLTVALNEKRIAEMTLNEVGTLLDSIDANRHALNSRIVEGISYASYIERLKAINDHIKATDEKLSALESKMKSSDGASSATIRRLKGDLDVRSKEIVGLQMDVIQLRDQNRLLSSNVVRKDSIISSKDELIKMKNSDVSSLEGLVRDINDQNRMKVANLYFAQAQALEIAAQRTRFAPRKKKETKREALELYKLSSSMGNKQAQDKIEELEKDLS